MIRAPSGVVQRAPRFSLSLPVRYRAAKSRTWHAGLTIDISRTGVLFTARRSAVSRGERLELRIRLPALRGACGSEICGTGRVVRVVAGQFRHQVAMAVAFGRHKLAPAWEPDKRSTATTRGPVQRGHLANTKERRHE